MSVNKYEPHVPVLPDDDANRQMVVGFELDPLLDPRKMYVLLPAGGWMKAIEQFNETHATEIEKYLHHHFVLIVDFDGQNDRLTLLKSQIPDGLADRVFIAGTWSEPAKLRMALKISLESVGTLLAAECRDARPIVWNHELLRHNSGELQRMSEKLAPIVFR